MIVANTDRKTLTTDNRQLTTPMTRTHFISDLHLFSRRSSAPELESVIQSAVKHSETFVLGGDIFDFRWSTQGSMSRAVEDSVDWLQRLIEVKPDCHFHYLLGNHDCHPEFVEALTRLSEQVPQLVWHRHMMRLGDRVFLHGDIVDTKVRSGEKPHDVLDSRRLIGEMRRPPNRVSHALYDAAIQVRVHRVVAQLAKRHALVLKRLAHYLSEHGETHATGVRDVYFGHTHRSLSSIAYNGMRFHNPGAAIKGLPFQIIEAL